MDRTAHNAPSPNRLCFYQVFVRISESASMADTNRAGLKATHNATTA